MRKLLVATALLLAASTAAATSIKVPDSLNATRDSVDLSTVKQAYNSNIDRVPGVVRSLVGNQDINLYIEGEENQTLRIDTSGARIDELERGGWENPSLEVWIEPDDMEALQQSEQPAKKLASMVQSGEIRYREHGFVNQLRFALVELFL